MVRRCSLIAILVLFGLSSVAESRERSPWIEKGKMMLLLIQTGQFQKAVAKFDAKMKQAVPADKLKGAWNGIQIKFGKFKRVITSTTGPYQRYQITIVQCQFEKGKVNLRVVFDKATKMVSGLFFIPAK